MISSAELREAVPIDIIKWAKLESIINDLFENFKLWEERNAELVNKFFQQEYFNGRASLIDKLVSTKPDVEFDDIKEEGINLALLLDNDLAWNLKSRLNNISTNEIKLWFIEEIFDRVKNEIWTNSPYDDFDTKCPLPGNDDVLAYFQTVSNYLHDKERASWAKKRIDILKGIVITNENLNSRIKKWIIKEIYEKVKTEIWTNPPYDDFDTMCPLPSDDNVWEYFQTVKDYLNGKIWKPWAEDEDMVAELVDILKFKAEWAIEWDTKLSDLSDIKDDFDTLLSFEIGKEADRAIDFAYEISNGLDWLLSNSFPAINTIIWEFDEYKFDESKLWSEFETKYEEIMNNNSLDDLEKMEQVNKLRWKYYIEYLKTKNIKIGNALEKLYENNFDYSKLDHTQNPKADPQILKDYLEKIADIRVRMLYDSEMRDVLKLNDWNFDDFSDFYKKLANPDEESIQLDASRGISLPVEKEIIKWENLRLNDINEFWKYAKSYDSLPIKFKIKQSDIDNLPIPPEDKIKLSQFLYRFKVNKNSENYIIKWWDVWTLIYLFFIINSASPITEISSEKREKMSDLFWTVKNHDNNNEEIEWNECVFPEQFKEEMEKLWPGKFENWSEVWIPISDSELPWWWYQWMKLKISDIDMEKWTFEWKVFWWELKFKSSLEWKTRKFYMNQDTLDIFRNLSKDKSENDWKVWLLPNPDNSDFDDFIKDKLGNKLWNDELNFPGTAIWNKGKFKKKVKIKNNKWEETGEEKEVEVKYFWSDGDDKTSYKVEYNPYKRSFTVSTSFDWEEKWEDWKKNMKNFSYKRDMDWNKFLIFFSQKKLVPQTKEESDKAKALAREQTKTKIVNNRRWKLNWFSLNNVKNWFKDIFDAFNKKLDEYGKRQTKRFEHIVKSPIIDALSELPLPPSVKYAIWELQEEEYNERDNYQRSRIEFYLKKFQSDPSWSDTFENLPPHVKTQYKWKSQREFVYDRVKNAKDVLEGEDLFKAAALLLVNVEKWSSAYRWLSWDDNSGLWVRALLGKEHYELFMNDKQKLINDIKANGKDRENLQDILATFEIDYIINNVSWSGGKLPYWGSHEERWIEKDWKYIKKHIDNPSKGILSNQFADKLKWATKWRFNASSVEEECNKDPHKNFALAEVDFTRFIKSSRFPKAAWNLKKMFLLAKTDENKATYQKCFLVYILSGVLDVHGKKDLREQAYEWAKTMWFVPWMLVKHMWHSEDIVALLDDFSGWDFSKNVKSFFHKDSIRNWKLNIDNLIKELDARWSVDKMKKFEKYSQTEFSTKKFPQDSVLKKLQDIALDTSNENMDNSLLKNSLVANSWWILSNPNVVRNRMENRDGEFVWEDSDEKDDRKKFWDDIATSVENMNPSSIEDVKLVLNQYLSWFNLNSDSDRRDMYSWIKTAYEYKDYKDFVTDPDYKVNMGKLNGSEVYSIIRYNFEGRVMKNCFNSHRIPDALKKALRKFRQFFQTAFENWILKNDTIVSDVFKIPNEGSVPLWSICSWNIYNKVYNNLAETVLEDESDVWDLEVEVASDSKEGRKRQKTAIRVKNYINLQIAEMEKVFRRNLPSTDFYHATSGGDDSGRTVVKTPSA